VAVNSQKVALAEVVSGWTGSVQTTVGPTTVTVTPKTRDSVASVWERLMRASAGVFGGTWDGWPNGAGRLVITGPATFSLTSSGTTQTRLQTTGSYTGATEYTAAAAYHSGTFPTLGIQAELGVTERAGGGVSGSGDYATSGGAKAPTGRVTISSSYANIVALESALRPAEVHDVWMGGRVISRFWIRSVRRARWGVGADQARLVLDAVVVTS